MATARQSELWSKIKDGRPERTNSSAAPNSEQHSPALRRLGCFEPVGDPLLPAGVRRVRKWCFGNHSKAPLPPLRRAECLTCHAELVRENSA